MLHRLNVNENYVRAAIIAASKVCDNKLSEEAFKGFICGCSATEEAKIALISSLGFRLVNKLIVPGLPEWLIHELSREAFLTQ